MINRNRPTLTYIGFAGSVLFFAYWIFQSFYYIPHDFANSYFGSYFLLKGEFDTGIFDPYTFNKKIYDEGIKQVFASFNPNPPSVALFFSPFALLSLPMAKLSFNIFSSALFMVCICRLCRHLKVESAMIFLLLPFVFFTPLRNQILFGQTYFLLFCLLTEGYLAYEKKNYLIASLLWSVAIFLKIFPAIIILFLIIKREWKMTLYLSSACLIILFGCVLIQGIDIWTFYIKDVLTYSSTGKITLAYEPSFQSATMLFKFLFIADSSLNPQTLADSTFLFYLCDAIFKTVIISICAIYILRSKTILSFGILFLGTILFLSYGSTYGNLLLVILFVVLYSELSLKRFAFISLILLLVCNFPISFFASFPALLKFPRLYLLLALLAVLVYTIRVKFEWKPFAVFLPLFLLPALFNSGNEPDRSTLLLDNQKHSLIYDYGVKGNSIVYYYWDGEGENSFDTGMQSAAISFSDIELTDNQIVYKEKKITNTADRKLKPGILNGNTIIYLSDKNRGIGFYTLRLINLE